jgi:hypothetical protein
MPGSGVGVGVGVAVGVGVGVGVRDVPGDGVAVGVAVGVGVTVGSGVSVGARAGSVLSPIHSPPNRMQSESDKSKTIVSGIRIGRKTERMNPLPVNLNISK